MCVFYSTNWFNINIWLTYLQCTWNVFLPDCELVPWNSSGVKGQRTWGLIIRISENYQDILLFIITEAEENIKSFFLNNDAIPTSVNHLADYGDQKGLRHVMYLIALRHFIHSPKLRMTVTSPNTYLVPKSVVSVT